MNIQFIVVILLCLFSIAEVEVAGANTTADIVGANPQSGQHSTHDIENHPEIQVDLKIDQTIFLHSFGEDTNDSLLKIEIDPMFSWKKSSRWQFYSHPVFIANPDNKSEAEKYFFDPQDSHLKFQKNEVSIQIGFNLVTWGVTDGYNPVDIVNTKLLYDPLQERKRGAPSLMISESLPWFDYDFIYMPHRQGSLLPQKHSRWLPQEVFVPQVPNNNLILLLPTRLQYQFGTYKALNNCLDNNIALRLQKSISLIDFSLSAFEGVSNLPILEPQVTGTITQVSPKTVIQVDPLIVLNTKDYRLRELGLSLVSHQWDFLFKYETSYVQALGNDSNLPGWTHENVLGFERTLNFVDSSVTVILQNSFLRSEKQNDSNISLSEIFRNAWMLGGRIFWKDLWSLSFMSLYDQAHSSSFEQITLGRRVADAWTVSLSANFINGRSDTPLGIYHKNQSVSLGLSRSF